MIAVDTSALVAILWGERDEPRMRDALDRDDAIISAANLLELQLVVAGRGNQAGWPQAEALLAQYEIGVRAFDAAQLGLAREAALRFGKGRHEARLNYGDCFAYALARSHGVPLLCTCGDFTKTDIDIA